MYKPDDTKDRRRIKLLSSWNLYQNGVHKAPAAVLYPAEQEWEGYYMPVEKPVRELLEHQIDCEIVPANYLLDAVVEENRLKIHKE